MSLDSRHDSVRSYATVTARGSLLNSGQWAANKLLTAFAMLVIARYLGPDDYGVAAQALAILGYVVFLSPITFGDVLVAHPREFGNLVASGHRAAIFCGAAMSILMLLLIPICVRVFDKYPANWLAGLLAILAAKPLAEAFLTTPLARLRRLLAYRSIAMIDGVVQFFATSLSLLLAVLGLKGVALVLPQVAAVVARCIWYRRTTSTEPEAPVSRSALGTLINGYIPGVAAQYVHNVILGMEVITLGVFAGDYQTGLFGFAFTLAAQANTLISYQLGIVLQPVLGQLQHDPDRQISGFLRAQRLLGLVCVPVSLAQAAVADALFRVAFAPKWGPSVPVFQILSLAQSFYFVAGPSMACLRSQRRFATFLWWQVVQFILAAPIYALSARWNGAVGVACASAGMWLASSIVVVWVCTWPAPRPIMGILRDVFMKPLVVSVPLALICWLVGRHLAQYGRPGDWLMVLVVVPLGMAGTLFVQRWVDIEYRTMLDSGTTQIVQRCRRFLAIGLESARLRGPR